MESHFSPVSSLTPWIFTFSFLLIALIFSLYFAKFREQHGKSLPPGPKPWPLVGCLPAMLRAKNKPTFRWIHKLMDEMNTEIACLRLGNVHVIAVTCPNISREFLRTQDDVFASRPLSMCSDVTTNGYLSTVLVPWGDQWMKMKRVLVTEVLSPARHRWLQDKRVEEADYLVCYLYNLCVRKGGLVNVRTMARQYCCNVIWRLIFNKRFFVEGNKHGGPGVEEEEYVKALFSNLESFFSFCISDFLPWLRGLDLDGHGKLMKQVTETISKYHDPLIEERVQQWRDGVKTLVEDLLDVLITLKDTSGDSPLLSVEEIKAQIKELMLAGVDNPSNAAEWAIAEMVKEPKILKKAVEELDRVVGKERLVQESDFPHLNYIKACAKEAFRLHPVSAFNVPHVSIADTTVANYHIPKGSHVLLSRMGLGRNPKIWDEPLKFRPERHLNNDGSEVVLTEPNLRLISFSTGRRGCKGVRLGSAVTTMLLARLIQGFDWSLPPEALNIDLNESLNTTMLPQPLIALAKPRLPAYMYTTSHISSDLADAYN